MRFGPPPRMTIFCRSVGSASQAGCRSRPRRSSTCRAWRRRTRRRRCRCACRPAAPRALARAAVTAVSAGPVSSASRWSEKPSALSRRSACASLGKPSAATARSASTMRASSRRNHGSKRLAAWMSSSDRPARIACAAISSRSGRGCDRAARNASRPPSPGGSTGSRPDKPVSMRAQALLQRLGEAAADRHRLAHRLHAVDSRAGVPGNFSKVKRGIFTTT